MTDGSGSRGPDTPPPGGRIDEGDARRIGVIGAIVLGVTLLLVFVVQNSRQVTVSFVFFDARMSLIWVIILSAVTGWIVGFLVARLVRRRYFTHPEG